MPDASSPERVARNDAIEIGVAERSLGRAGRTHEQLRPDVRPRDDGRERDRLVRAQRVAQSFVQAHQSIGSTNRWIVPPHVRPTANASSSE